MMDLKTKIFWITGASSGIGRSLAMHLATKDAKLILSSRNVKALEKVRSLCEYKNNIVILPLDLGDYQTIGLKVTQALSFFGRIDFGK